MERESSPRPPTTPPEAPKVPPAERDGVFERWRKKDKKQETTEKVQKIPTPERPTESKKREKFAKLVTNFLFGEKPGRLQEAAAPEPETSEAGEAPILKRAGRMRRMAREVISRVLGAAEAEHENVKRWDGPDATPLDTEPLVEAAGDLRDAVHDLEDAMPAEAVTDTNAGGYNGAGTSVWQRVAQTEANFTSHMAERFSRRVQDLEQQLEAQNEQAEKNKARVAAVAAGLGIAALLGVVIVGHEYVAHGKIKKQQKKLNKARVEDRAEIILQRQQLDEMTRRERAAHYERMSKIAHRQADETREVARELQQEAPVSQVPRGNRVQTLQSVEWSPASQRQPEQVAARPEHYTSPVVTVETADTTERTPSLLSSQKNAQFAGGVSGGAAGGATTQPVVNQPQPAQGVPLSPAAQRALAARKARAQLLASSAWLYGVALAGGIIVVILAIVFLG